MEMVHRAEASNGGATPHPVLLPMGEGTPARRLRQRSLSHGERDRVRGVAPVLRDNVPALLLGLFLALFSLPALAVEPLEQLKDPKLEARAREISAGLRCLVCQNQSIDDSDAPLAKDLRLIVRRELEKGATDQQVVEYVVARYGEFVLLKPRFRLNTLILWLTPLLLLAGGGLLAARMVRRQPEAQAVPPLTPEEQKELQVLLKQDAGSGKS